MIRNNKKYDDSDYKYIGVVNVTTLNKLFKDCLDEDINAYSLVLLYKGITYLVSIFKDETFKHKFQISIYKKDKMKPKDFDNYEEFIMYLKELFYRDDILVLLEMYNDNNYIMSYPVIVNDYLSKNTITRSDELYLHNMPQNISFYNLNKSFIFYTLFTLINFLVGISSITHTGKVFYIGLFTLISSIISFIFMLYKYGYKTSVVNGLIKSNRLLKITKTYNFNEIKSVQDVVQFNLFNTKKYFKLHMKDNSVVRLDYYDDSDIIDEERKETIVYIKEQLINNKTKVDIVNKNNKLLPIIIVVIYIGILILF